MKANPGITRPEVSRINDLVQKADGSTRELKNVLKKTHVHLAVIVAQLRAVSVEVVEAIVSWQSQLVNHESRVNVAATPEFSSRPPQKALASLRSSILPPPFVWKSQNYLSKMATDLSFFASCHIACHWIGFNPASNIFFVPPDGLDVQLRVRHEKELFSKKLSDRRQRASRAVAARMRFRMAKTAFSSIQALKGRRTLSAARKSKSKSPKGRKRAATVSFGVEDGNIANSDDPELHDSDLPRRRCSSENPSCNSNNQWGGALNNDDALDKNEASRASSASAVNVVVLSASDRSGHSGEDGGNNNNAQDIAQIRDSVLSSLTSKVQASVSGTTTPSSDLDDGSLTDSDDLSSGEEDEINFPDVFPEVQLVSCELPERLKERCRVAFQVIEEEPAATALRMKKKEELMLLRNSNFRRPVTAGTATVTMGVGMLPSTRESITMTKIALMNRSVLARPTTAQSLISRRAESHRDTKLSSPFFMTQQKQNSPVTTKGNRTINNAGHFDALSPSLRLQRKQMQSSLSEVFVGDSVRHSKSPFPVPIAGKILVNIDSRKTSLEGKIGESRAIVIVQAFGRLILAKRRTFELRAYRLTSKSASVIQRMWRGKKGRGDFFKKLQSKKAASLRERIEARETQKAAEVLQRFFDNVRMTAKEKADKAGREKRRIQEKLWMRRAMLDSAVFQIQRVYRNYLKVKVEWEGDFNIKFSAARKIQGGVRMKLARKRARERKSRQTIEAFAAEKNKGSGGFHEALITIQCWVRGILARERVQKRKTRRKSQLFGKLVEFGNIDAAGAAGVLSVEDDGSVQSGSIASITELMGAVAATDAVKIAESCAPGVSSSPDENVEKLAVVPNHRRGRNARKSICVILDEDKEKIRREL